MSESPELARRYAQLETSLVPDKQRSVARGPYGVIGVLALLCLAVAVVVAIDLNRLQTPRGTALGWAGATVFGDCAGYERLSVPGPRDDDDRTALERCAALQEQARPAREESARYSIDVIEVGQDGDEARVRLRLGRPAGSRIVDLPLRRGGDAWVVVRTDTVCRVVRCP